jgi:hypothetical protein
MSEQPKPRLRKPHPPHRMVGRHKRPNESTPAFLARIAPVLDERDRTIERNVRRRILGLDTLPLSSGRPR